MFQDHITKGDAGMELSNQTPESLESILSMFTLYPASKRHIHLRIIIELKVNHRYHKIKL